MLHVGQDQNARESNQHCVTLSYYYYAATTTTAGKRHYTDGNVVVPFYDELYYWSLHFYASMR